MLYNTCMQAKLRAHQTGAYHLVKYVRRLNQSAQPFFTQGTAGFDSDKLKKESFCLFSQLNPS